MKRPLIPQTEEYPVSDLLPARPDPAWLWPDPSSDPDQSRFLTNR
ncbi:hypothetical protein B4135_0420 [Caldibacillus debilis]|uniref:Uncharacterized protein n=1 Tax=Caldibacillus debilis TaxID=301148 RepID=A0A150L9N8_9BACI|nr:hypothetical protein B4135_0420 [Caldibacillus debilis]